MVATTILYFLPEKQSPKRSNGACGPPSPVWQGLRAPVACASLVMSLPCIVDSAAPRSYSDDGGGEREGVCAAVANASGRGRDLSETPRSSKVYRSSGRLGYGQSHHGTVLIIEPEASLRTLLREVPELEDYDAIEAAHSYEGLQAADVALLEGVTLDIRYLII